MFTSFFEQGLRCTWTGFKLNLVWLALAIGHVPAFSVSPATRVAPIEMCTGTGGGWNE